MNDSAQKLTGLFAVFLISASVFYGVINSKGRLGSNRPVEVPASNPSFGSQRVPARLWQDPFEVFALPPGSASDGGSSLSPVQINLSATSPSGPSGGTNSLAGREIRLLSVVDPKPAGQPNDSPLWQSLSAMPGPLAILIVSLESMQYPEDKEVRRRLRYAVEVALLTTDFAPDDRSHIGRDSLHLINRERLSSFPTNVDLAFEWFTRTHSGRGPQHVLVLWLKEEMLAFQPVAILGEILTQLEIQDDPESSVCLIGPRSSDTLRAIAISPPKAFWDPTLSDRFDIHSPEATVPDSVLFGKPDSLRRESILSLLHTNFSNHSFENWIATDDQLARLLVQELRNRRIDPSSNPGDVVALISEADTFYGRSLPMEFEQSLAHGMTTNIWRFVYLRGLEGTKLATDKGQDGAPAPAASPTPEGLVQAALQKYGEKPEGEAQKDYAERLADYLARQDEQLRKNNAGIRAVGLMGSDVYDKLVLLQALRPKLPGAVFFTTDLDARLWMPPDQLRFTRNLVVASSYSLEPDQLNGRFPPFRDVYQAATFAACRGELLQLEIKGVRSYPAVPRDEDLRGKLFEIGRHGPVELIPAHSRLALQPADAAANSNAQRIAELPHRVRLTLIFLVVGLGLFALAVTLLGGFRSQQPLVRESERIRQSPSLLEPPLVEEDFRLPVWLLGPVALGLLLVSAFVLKTRDISRLPGEEPWNLTDGISIWPTEFIRLLAFLLSAAFPFVVAAVHARHRRALWQHYFSCNGMSTPPPPARFWKRWPRLRINHWRVPVTGGASPARGPGPAAPSAQVAVAYATRPDGTGFNLKFDPHLIYVAVKRYVAPVASLVTDSAAFRGLWEHRRVDASQLFLDYREYGLPLNRHLRTFLITLAYILTAWCFMLLTRGIPERFCIRGTDSFLFDNQVLAWSVAGFLFVLFYVLDATRLAGKMLDSLARGPTAWPAWLTRKWAEEKCVREEEIDGWLDVQFAVAKTAETGRLMVYPFLIFLLILVSRNQFFEDWHWSASLVAVFVVNFLLAAACWAFVRHSARFVQKEALARLHRTIQQVLHGPANSYLVPCRESGAPAGTAGNSVQSATREHYAKRLTDLATEIEAERRAAFAHWIQDPTYAALFLPTGLTGVLAALLQYSLLHR